MKSKTYSSRLKAALTELNTLVEKGAEIPDVDWKVAKDSRVSLEDLIKAYDEQFEWQAALPKKYQTL